MFIAVSLSLYEVIGHMCNYSKPYLQRYIIRILLIVPIYSLNAWIAMILPVAALYLDSSREVYESFVIYSFMKYLLNFLHYDTNLQQYINHKLPPKHIFPFCCLPSCVGGKSFMLRCKHGILQYVVIRPITTLIAFVSQIFGFYGEGNYNPFSGYTYPALLIINNLSQFTAMYCLVIFYSGYKEELKPMKPLAKFFSIKLVVFFSFFQSVLITGLMKIELVAQAFGSLFPDMDDNILIGKKLQEFLICIDMVIAAVGHLFAFSYKPFMGEDGSSLLDYNSDDEDGSQPHLSLRNRSCCVAFCNIFDFNDEKTDVREHIGQIVDRVKQTFNRPQPLPAIVATPDLLMAPEEATNNQANGTTNKLPNNYQSMENI